MGKKISGVYMGVGSGMRSKRRENALLILEGGCQLQESEFVFCVSGQKDPNQQVEASEISISHQFTVKTRIGWKQLLMCVIRP